MKMRWFIAIGLLCLLLTSGLSAQVQPSLYDFARPSLKWYTIETEHFSIHFHADEEGEGSSRSAQVTARIAEEIYEPITALYDYEPDTKVSIILKDFEDYSNGAAYFFDNKIEIWAPSLESPLRGSHNWLRNVITHEFTHIVQVQKTIKSSRRLPVFYLQWLNYEDVRRPDVLYGYPDGIVSYPIPGLSNPAWFAEGTAQFQRFGLDYDRWDTHRDMLLRTMMLEDREFSLPDMGSFFNKTSIEREQVYNHGFAFTHYLANTYGETVLRDISAALSKWQNWNIDRAITEATGTPARTVHAEWVTAFKDAYRGATEAIAANQVEGDLVETEGFANAYPTFSPDGSKLAYISNRGEDFNLLSLYVQDVELGETQAFHIDGLQPEAFALTCSHRERIKAGVGGAVAWHPDGDRVVYSRVRDTPTGFSLSDLYELHLESKEVERLTENGRAIAPAYAPNGRGLVFVQQRDGSTNLAYLDFESEEITSITNLERGEQVTEPVWHPGGEWIYFGYQTHHGRDLYRVRSDGTKLEAVRATEADERSPAFSPDGETLYFSSDASGIYNLYQLPTDDFEQEPVRLTNVIGGAFMPSVSVTGQVAYAHYQADGYRIAMLEEPEPVSDAVAALAYTPPVLASKQGPADEAFTWDQLNAFDDTDLMRLAPDQLQPVSSGPQSEEEPLPVAESETEPDVQPYSNVYTSFGFYPVLRFDMYAKPQRGAVDAQIARRFQGGTLWRNTKAGFYMSSREVLEGLTMFGGLLVGPGSVAASSLGDYFTPANLLKLERDLFLQFEYKKGLGRVPKRWSPQVSLEMFNIRRNVQNGLSIEEFPCTACYPDTTFTDIAYTLWEADVYVRSKVSRSTLLEVGYRYSPYRVRTESFFSREFGQTIEGSASRYFIGHAVAFKAYFEQFHPTRHSEVVPHGLRAEIGYELQPGRLLETFEIEDGLLVPGYTRYTNHRLSADVRLGWRLKKPLFGGTQGFGLRVKASTILGAPVDDFFDDYVGGLIGARGYPFYALGGNEAVWLQASYQLPLLPDINRQFLFLYPTKLYARIYADAATAWSGSFPGLSEVRKDIGAELRLALGSFYLFPTAIFVSATYGIDSFELKLQDGFLTPEGRDFVEYGNQVLWHFGLLFNFDL